jgi:5-methylthioribose kinase
MLTPADIRAHLGHRLPAFQPACRPKRLAGGNLNFVWRVKGRTDSVIVKAAPPYIATAPDIALDPNRILFEAECLSGLGPGGELADLASARIRAPRCLDIDAKRHILIMEDVGERPHLGERLLDTGGRTDWGRRLGEFIGKLHLRTVARPDIARRFNNIAIQRTRLAAQYRAIDAFFAKAGLAAPAGVAARVADLGERLLRPGVCLTMGDLWPPSILIDTKVLRLIDWEFAHYGNPAQDIGHLAAHLWMHAQCAPNREYGAKIETLSHAFMAHYTATVSARAETLLNPQVYSDCAIHFGAEILMRTLGPFAHGYLYDGLSIENERVQQAIAVASESILAGQHSAFAALA